MKIFRQGDVLLIKVSELPKKVKNVTPKDRIVLAYGEVTGHAHAIYPEKSLDLTVLDKVKQRFAANDTQPMRLKAKLWDGGAERFLQVIEKTALRHEEHLPIPLDPGVYKVVRQREYDPVRERMVAD